VIDGDRMWVPLTLLEPDYAGTFIEEKRVQPIALQHGDWKIEQHVELAVPPGWTVAKPRKESAVAPGFEAAFEIAPTAGGAKASVVVSNRAGYHEPSGYPEYRKVGEFLRRARTQLIELVKK
jgi:hypothetical protein